MIATVVCLIVFSASSTFAQRQDLPEAKRLSEQALQLSDKREYDEAVSLAKRALWIFETIRGPHHPEVATALNNLAAIYRAAGDLNRAEPLDSRAQAIREKALGAEDVAVAISLSNLAMSYVNKGDYAAAEPIFGSALKIFEKVNRTESAEFATVLDNLGGLYHQTGEFERAEPLHQRALAIREKVFGKEHLEVAGSLNNLASTLGSKRDYGKAELLFHRALEINEKALGPVHPEVARSLNNLAGVYMARSDYMRAQPMYERALEINEKAFGSENPYVAMSLNNLAQVYERRNDRGKAEPLYRRALAIMEKAYDPGHPSVATLCNNLAMLVEIKGESAAAESLYLRALAIREKIFGPEHPDVAQSLNNLATMYNGIGDHARAEPLYLRALAIREKVSGPEHPDTAGSYNNLAATYQLKGDYDKVVSYAFRAAEIREHNIASVLAISSEKQKQLYLDDFIGHETNAIVSLSASDVPKNVAAIRLALTTILRRKGRSLDAMTDQIATLRRYAAPEDKALLDELTAARSQHANFQLGTVGGNLSVEKRQTEIAAISEKVENLEATISRKSAAFRVEVQPVTIPNVQAALPADAALVEIFSYIPFDPKVTSPLNSFGAGRYVAYVLYRDGEPRFVDLGEAAPIDASAEKLREAFAPDACFAEKRKLKQDPNQCLDVSAARQAARVLDEQTMRPIRALLGYTKHIFLSPDGALNLIPFAALVDENNKYLVENYTLTYLTNGRDLLRLQIAGDSKDPPTVLANPLYNLNRVPATQALRIQTAKRDAEFRSLDFTKLFYQPLDGTAREATTLAGLVPNARIWMDKQATEAALKSVSRPRILHVATHGFFLSDQPKPVANSGGRQLVMEKGQANSQTLKNENPMLRSGLILAGVNQRSSGSNEDGVLTAAEAAGLDLFGTKLVVLSACETGLGEVRNGDGVYGLRRALVLAGSESQVMSLWKVSDDGTQELMTDYYTRLQRGDGRTEALRQVQLSMIRGEKRKHPFYWASFIQSGAWTPLEGKVSK